MERACILVVEDDEDVAGVLGSVLKMDGHRVVTVPDGDAALEALEEVAFDLVICDIEHPGVPAEGIHEHVRRACPKVPFLLNTGWTPREVRPVSLFERADGFLQKPWTLSELRGAVKRLLGSPAAPPGSPEGTRDA